jgi:hypothetical protein
MLNGLFDGAGGQFVKQHTVKPPAFFLEHFGRMPGNGFAFAIRVGGQVDFSGVAGGGLKVFDHFLFAGDGAIFRLEAILDIDAHLFFRQVPDVTDRCGDVVLVTDHLGQCFDLGGRFDND